MNNITFKRDIYGRFKSRYTLENDTRDHSSQAIIKKKKANSKYYPFYNNKFTDKEIAKETNSGLTTVQSWRYRRGLTPNHHNNMDGRNSDGTFKQKRINGSRDIYTHARDGLKDWKYNILKRDNFRCTKCNGSNNLEVHHNKTRYLEILDMFIPNRDIEKELSWKEKKMIAEEIVKYHEDNKVSGITLCNKCHRELHRNEL